MIDHWQKFYGNRISVICIYISEAHAEDEWPLSNEWKIYQHKNIEDRISAAKLLQEKKQLKTPLFVDSMEEDNFETNYAAWPERGFVFHKNKLQWICHGVANGHVKWQYEIQQWLEDNVGKYTGKQYWEVMSELHKAEAKK